MMGRQDTTQREREKRVSVEVLVPADHMVRQIDKAIDFNFIYDLVEDRYAANLGRKSIDPVVLIKIPMIKHLFGISSMRCTLKEIEVNMAYRWFLGLGITDPVPHFTVFGKNYVRRFIGTGLFEKIFARILEECIKHGFVKGDTIFADATHVKASANREKRVKVEVEKQARYYEEELRQEINRDREAHGKKPLKEEPPDAPPEKVTRTQSTTDPDSGMFVKGEHERSFAYMVQTGCDVNGFILGYKVCAGNVHDSVSFPALYEELKKYEPGLMVMDAGYKTPAIARQLLRDGVLPVFPYTAPKTGKGKFRKTDFVYDEYNDCYLCPGDQMLAYSTTDRDGYRQYKSDGEQCKSCPHLNRCTDSQNHVKVVRQHVWHEYMDMVEEVRLTLGMREVYGKRKESIERVFADAKEKHEMRHTRLRGLLRVTDQIGLLFACMNLKKMAKWLSKNKASRLFLLFGFNLPEYQGAI